MISKASVIPGTMFALGRKTTWSGGRIVTSRVAIAVALLEDAPRLGDPELDAGDPDVGGVGVGGDLLGLGVDLDPPRPERLRDARRYLEGALDDDRLLHPGGLDQPEEGLPCLRRVATRNTSAETAFARSSNSGKRCAPDVAVGNDRCQVSVVVFMICCLRKSSGKEAGASPGSAPPVRVSVLGIRLGYSGKAGPSQTKSPGRQRSHENH